MGDQLPNRPDYAFSTGEIKEMAELILLTCNHADGLPHTSFLHYAMQKKGRLLENRRIDLRDSEYLNDESGSVLVLIYDQNVPAPHLILSPLGDSDKISTLARRFFICHEIAHLLLDDEKDLLFRAAGKKAETPEENQRANLFAAMAVLGRGRVAKRQETRTRQVLDINKYADKQFTTQTLGNLYDALVAVGLIPPNQDGSGSA